MNYKITVRDEYGRNEERIMWINDKTFFDPVLYDMHGSLLMDWTRFAVHRINERRARSWWRRLLNC